MPTTHSMTKTSEYRAWAGMMQRCYNPKNRRYSSYGGRGIAVCVRWKSFENFISDMGLKPSADLSIDRIDNDKGYSPDNCRWATRSQQQNNKSPYNGENLMRGDDHWTRKDPARSRSIAAENICKAHGSGENNPNSKMDLRKANALKQVYKNSQSLTMTELGKKFGIGRETARKIVRGKAWVS
jgi:hypothetical protein